ncbi:MAG: tetraacyldisaccharide 4'-kinase [Betaproteobacteria bacterium]|nr:MAG: tetraacyldisaccharide 4'-kinase [Betaproteobacteria bacterium]
MTIERLVGLWYRPPRLAYVLTPLGLIYRSVARLRRALYRWGMLRSTRFAVPVIVVGNITVGGTGKTPLTIWLAESLSARGMAPGVVCKSYAASAVSASRVARRDDPAVRGDEAVLLASRLKCPVWSGPDRVATARAMLAARSRVDVVICDDGLQHYPLARDFEIALIDAGRGFGNGLSLPAGPMREPRSRLRSVDALVLNGEGMVAGVPDCVPTFRMTLQGSCLRNLIDPARMATPGEFGDKRIAAIAGIGHPERFFDHLRGLGFEFRAYPFPDHYEYRAPDLSLPDAEVVLMTEKDAIKCARFADARMWVLPVSAQLEGDLLRFVIERIGMSRQAPAHRTPLA